jgi:AAA+ superfamily predicted ATPase
MKNTMLIGLLLITGTFYTNGMTDVHDLETGDGYQSTALSQQFKWPQINLGQYIGLLSSWFKPPEVLQRTKSALTGTVNSIVEKADQKKQAVCEYAQATADAGVKRLSDITKAVIDLPTTASQTAGNAVGQAVWAAIDTIVVRMTSDLQPESGDNQDNGESHNVQHAIGSLSGTVAQAVVKEFREGGQVQQALHEIVEAAGNDTDQFIKKVGEQTNKQLQKGSEGLLNSFVKGAAITTGLAIATITAWYGSKVLWSAIERNLMTPKLIIKSSKVGMLQKLKNLVVTPQAAELSKMVFSKELERELENIIATTKIINQKIKEGKKNIFYRNVLLWGPPGTGKTMFAEKLALASGMEFATMSGSSFSKFDNGGGIRAMDDLFVWAGRSKKGLVVFIDEAESFLGEREGTDVTSESYQLLTNFLNHTGTRSNKIMFIFATNHPNSLDAAMNRRIDSSIEMKLPTTDERAEVLKLYRHQFLLSDKANNKQFIQSVEHYLSDTVIDTIAKNTQGLSYGELQGIMNGLKSDIDATREGLLREELVKNVVLKAIEKNKQFATKFGRA